MKMNNSKKTKRDTKKIFLKKGPCSSAFFYILNREFGYPMETEVRAAESLCGGIMQQGYQCGMLWGSALAVGAESFRRHDDRDQAIGIAVTATEHLLESFLKRAKSADCRDITSCNFSKKLIFNIIKYFLFGKAVTCIKLADNWAPEAIQSATEGLSCEQIDLPRLPISCASEVAKKMGASDEKVVTVAGFAGGIGLSGNACGALSAAIWMNTLNWCRKQTEKSFYTNPNAKNILKAFYEVTDSEILCHKICGQHFKTIEDHTKFIKNGGCDKLINVLARA
ncbi:C-GCAxxG-C-C family protein [bacterium]|nr:C-GCAxxG-C-C family protein [bacterium]